jgi:hypothetical protein
MCVVASPGDAPSERASNRAFSLVVCGYRGRGVWGMGEMAKCGGTWVRTFLQTHRNDLSAVDGPRTPPPDRVVAPVEVVL